MKRVFLIVLDSVGIGALPDAAEFGDEGTNTLLSASIYKGFDLPNLASLGLGMIEGVACVKGEYNGHSDYGRMAEMSRGKDTTVGHWELAGLVSDHPLPTYPNGFPDELIAEFSEKIGRGVLCNKTYSGTEVIHDYGEEHIRTGKVIVYTSADSVFQIAAHEDVVPLEELYDICITARKMLSGEHAVGRVIARPFIGEYPNFTRTAGRHDYSLEPTDTTVLDRLKALGLDVIGVGKISDIFAGCGITESYPDKGNEACMARTMELVEHDFHGLCFVNLVDFDMVYGHRRDPNGYGKALCDFDRWLGDFLPKLGDDDALIITADHGCDPGYTKTTDHTREYVPYLCCHKGSNGNDIGTKPSFTFVADEVMRLLETE
ncbi:MAG: phosphopentomutase [Ruminococcaceae bacterium]|nr:phosphopentomutase [Oscillospiraceae bacterium]